MSNREVIWIIYTTRYRKGGDRFKRAAKTLKQQILMRTPGMEVVAEAVESKSDIRLRLKEFMAIGKSLAELHFIGHSGMYGPMFGNTAWPEQFSPFEWRCLDIPFTNNAQAWFHACRSARWFAPFFARTFKVPAYGYSLYTTFSLLPDRFVLDSKGAPDSPLYVIGCPGRKSHGLIGSVMKYSGFARCEDIKRFDPEELSEDNTYNSVALKYDEVFRDITVRADEWRWISGRLSLNGTERILDIGCGNGSFLRKIAGNVSSATGVDRSQVMIELANRNSMGLENTRFLRIDGPQLPFNDSSFDVVVSLMSFRYLDWDPVMAEIRRVLVPGGRLLVVDMLQAPVKFLEFPRLLVDKLKNYINLLKNPCYRKALRSMISDPAWKVMLKHNPMRAEHEFRWYFESRFPGKKVELLNLGMYSRILAFDSGNLDKGKVSPLSYP